MKIAELQAELELCRARLDARAEVINGLIARVAQLEAERDVEPTGPVDG